MKLRDLIDRTVEVFSPRAARHRMAERIHLDMLRDYDIASHGRRNSGWRRPASGPNREGRKALTKTRDSGYDLVRNNKYAAAIELQLVAHLIGDGMAPRAVHKTKAVREKAQKAMDRFMRSRVDGRHDGYGVQRLAASAMVTGGEAFLIWSADDKGPDGRVRVVEGALCDHNKNEEREGYNPIVQGVEFDKDSGERVAYWMFDRHPGEDGGYYGQSRRWDARHIDHLFEARRPGQVRGISWLATVGPTLRDIAETVDAKMVKEKVAACLAVVLTSAEGGPAIDPFARDGSASGAPAASAEGKPVDKIAPGQVLRARSGESATVVNPPASGEGVGVIRQELMGVAASTIPYHMLTGDPSQANYSALRATTNPFFTRLDDVQSNTCVPFLGDPWPERRMRRLAIETGDRRVLDVEWEWAFTPRRSNDPIKDFMAELAEVRSGVKSMPQVLAERGINPETHLAAIAAFWKEADALKLAFDSDPRRVNGSGGLQPPTGYLYGGGASNQGD